MRKKKPGPRPGNKTKFQTSITFDLELKPILEALPNTSEFVNKATWREVKRRKPTPTTPERTLT